LTLSFVVLAIGSAIYVSVASWNYLFLYPALEDIQNDQTYQVDRLLFLQTPNASVLDVKVSVRNPSQYWGLRLFSTATTINFTAVSPSGNVTIFPSFNPNASRMIGSPLGPRSVDAVDLMIPLTPNQTTQLVSFRASPIIGLVNLRVDISTFLESVAGTIVYTRTQEVPLSFT